MPPTLEELLTRTPLPDADPYYNGSTVEELPVCGPDDSPRDDRRRLLVSPQNPTVYFPLSKDVSSTTTFLNIDDFLWRKVLTATGGFVYNRTATGANGREIPLGPGVAHICRSESDTGGRYEVFLTDNSIINNTPANAAPLRRVSFNFRFDEIRKIVKSGILSNEHWRVDPTDHRHLDLMPDETEIDGIIKFIQRSDFSSDRRDGMVGALRQFQQDMAHQSMDMQKDMRSEMRWQMIGMGVLTLFGGIYTGMLVSGKAGPIHNAIGAPFRGLYNLIKYPFDHGEGWGRFWNEMTMGVRYRGLSTLLDVGTNMTEQARLGEFRPVADPTTPQVAQQIENTIDSKHNTMSVLVEGPPGWGKEEIMKTLALRHPETVYIRVTPNGMMGGTMYRGQLEQRLNDIPKEITKAKKEGRKVVLFVDEFHEALSAGKTQESTTSLLEHWKGELARGDIKIVGFSTPRELLKARYIAGVYNDPASRARLSPEFQEEITRFEKDGVRQNLELRPLLNRFQPVILPARPAEDIVTILKDKVAERKGSSGFEIDMSDEALKRIAEMSESPLKSEGHIPRTALALFNGVIDANTKEGVAKVTVTTAMVEDYVKTNYPDISQRFLGGSGRPGTIFSPDAARSEITSERKSKAIEALDKEVPGWNVFNTEKQQRILEKFWEFHSGLEAHGRKTYAFTATLKHFQKTPDYQAVVGDSPIVTASPADSSVKEPRQELTRDQVEDALKQDREFRDLPPDEKKNRVDQVMTAWKGATPEVRDSYRISESGSLQIDVDAFSKRALERKRGLGEPIEVRPDDKREARKESKERPK